MIKLHSLYNGIPTATEGGPTRHVYILVILEKSERDARALSSKSERDALCNPFTVWLGPTDVGLARVFD